MNQQEEEERRDISKINETRKERKFRERDNGNGDSMACCKENSTNKRVGIKNKLEGR